MKYGSLEGKRMSFQCDSYPMHEKNYVSASIQFLYVP